MRPIKQSENVVESEIIGWLRVEGWIVRRQHVGLFMTLTGHRIKLGDIGECDWRAFRSLPGPGCATYLEIEIKATGEEPTDVQREYMVKRKRQGIACIWADSLAMFLEKYQLLFGEEQKWRSPSK